MRSRWLLAFTLGCTSALASCDGSIPSRSTVSPWPTGEAIEAGSCRFVLTRADLYHSSSWNLEVEITATNEGPERTKCGFSAQTATSSDTALTNAASISGSLGPNESWTRMAYSREANLTGMSSGSADGAWALIEVSEGTWPLGETTTVRVTPQRTRPPD
ncbi:MAG: hypothetical protein AAF799_11625 [Myxococcota bacterium]